ncbi:MAG: hypothetical protein RL559_1466 [Pseudomonadota bacterium]|jgi:hypothetical protein
MKHLGASSARRSLLLLGGLAMFGWAQAGPRRARGQRAPAQKGPGETPQERDKRLLRECKGRPNAGACEGYAS